MERERGANEERGRREEGCWDAEGEHPGSRRVHGAVGRHGYAPG